MSEEKHGQKLWIVSWLIGPSILGIYFLLIYAGVLS
jgi:hypothetical protein